MQSQPHNSLDSDLPADSGIAASQTQQRVARGVSPFLFEALPGAWLFVNNSGTVVHANSHASLLLGYEPNEVIELPFVSIAPAFAHDDIASLYLATTCRSKQRFTAKLRHKQGHGIRVAIECSKVLLQDQLLLVALIIPEETVEHRVPCFTSPAKITLLLQQLQSVTFQLLPGKLPCFVYFGRECLSVLGYASEELCHNPEALHRLVHSEDHTLFLDTLTSHDYAEAVVRFYHRNGSITWMNVRRINGILPESGEPIDAIASNVTYRLKHEQALQDSVDLLRSVIDHAPVIVWSLDTHGRFELSEGRGLVQLGLVPGQVVGSLAWDLYASHPEVLDATNRALSGEVVDGTWDLGFAQFDYHYTPHFDRDGAPSGATGVAVDVTRRHRAEHANQQLLAAIEQANESVVVTDREGRVTYVNPAYERASGYSEQDAISELWQRLEIRDDIAFLENLRNVLQLGTPWSGRSRSKRKPGQEFYEDATLSPIRGKDGSILGAVAVKRDITEQLRWEEQLRHSQKMEAVGQLAGGIAHDFNNLLQVIRGNIELLSHQRLDEYPEHLVGDIAHATDRATKLVRQLLTFSRKDPVAFVPLRLDQVIFALLGMLRRLLGEDVTIEWKAISEPIYVRANAPQLEQVVVNLCVNARDAMKGGGTLRISLEHSKEPQQLLLETSSTIRPYAVLTIEDTGEGLNPEVRERIFEPFFTTKDVGKGTGLGLATVYAIVERHGGYIEVDSEVGVGTRFRLFFPTAEAEEPSSARVHAPRSIEGKGRLVLIAEDDPQIRNLTARFLIRQGFRVRTAIDGVDAESQILNHEHELSLVILDAIMPRLQGPELFRRMRARGSLLPCLLVTGYDSSLHEPILDQDEAFGLALVLQKPFDYRHFFDCIATLLRDGQENCGQ